VVSGVWIFLRIDLPTILDVSHVRDTIVHPASFFCPVFQFAALHQEKIVSQPGSSLRKRPWEVGGMIERSINALRVAVEGPHAPLVPRPSVLVFTGRCPTLQMPLDEEQSSFPNMLHYLALS